MPAPASPPWTLLLSKLQQADPARLSYAEVLAAKADPVLLVRDSVLQHGNRFGYQPRDCEHGCEPNLDFDSRAAEKLVGVACPNDEACWRGWRWVPETEVLSLRCESASVFAALRAANGLEPLALPAGAGVTPVGRLKRRGLDVAVVWLRPRRGFEPLARGLRQQLARDGLIVLVPKVVPVPFTATEGIAVLELPLRDSGNLELSRGLDQLAPTYRKRASDRSNADLEVDWIHLRFATEEHQHVLMVNGHRFVGFQKADVLFARLLYLAACRKFGPRGGWKHKASLVGAFSARPTDAEIKAADKALEPLREELVCDDVPGLTEAEQDAIFKAERGTGRVRVSVTPENLEFDESLAQLQWKVPATTKGKRLSDRQSDGIELAQLLLTEARRLGVPGEALTSPASPPTKRRSSRSAT